jgi:hypothetical protein
VKPVAARSPKGPEAVAPAGRRSRRLVTVREMPWWGVVSSTASPVVLIGGWTVAAKLQSQPFSQVAGTVSALAATNATDRWVMSLVFLVVGACDVVTGLALRLAAPVGRMILIAGAVAGMLVAAAPEHPTSASVAHFIWAALGFAGLAAWPLAAWRRGPSVPWGLRRPFCYAAVGVQLILLGWFVAELVGGGGQVGLAERVVGAAQALWLLAVVLSCRASRQRLALEMIGRQVTQPTAAERENRRQI